MTLPSLGNLNELYETSVTSLQSAFLAFNNQGSGGRDIQETARLQSRGADLRNSIRFRLDSILVHLDLLNVEQEQILQELTPGGFEELQRRAIMRRAATRQRYLFDDIAFAVVSAFDYFGNLVGLVRYGEQRRKMKWDRVIRYARDAELERREHGSTWIHDSRTAALALALQAEWLAKLAEYRADAIHYRADVVEAHMITEWKPSYRLSAFQAYVPIEFVRWLSRAPVRPPHLAEGASLISCAEWLAEQTLSRVTGLADALAGDIGPRV